jgi:acid phosphatase (class A)
MTLGLVLCEVFPDKKDAILAHARLMGWHRVQIARHYPTDIYAGRVLAQAIVRELDANPQFQHDLAEVKAEVAAAQQYNN